MAVEVVRSLKSLVPLVRSVNRLVMAANASTKPAELVTVVNPETWTVGANVVAVELNEAVTYPNPLSRCTCATSERTSAYEKVRYWLAPVAIRSEEHTSELQSQSN